MNWARNLIGRLAPADYWRWLVRWSHEYDPASWAGHFLLAAAITLLGYFIGGGGLSGIATGGYGAWMTFIVREASDALRVHAGRLPPNERREKTRDTVIDYLSPILAVMVAGTSLQLVGAWRTAFGLLSAFAVAIVVSRIVYEGQS